MIIKVCGLKEKQNIEKISALDVEMVGLNFYPPSKRFLPEEKYVHFNGLPKKIKKAGVFVNEQIDTLLDIAQKCELDYLQLHGNESPEYCRSIPDDYKIIKVFGITEGDDINAKTDGFSFCDYFLFDTKSPQYGGTGQKFDWNTLKSYTRNTPFLLSGGIGPEDYEHLKKLNHPQFVGVDINSKFESSPGIKKVEEVASFIQNLKRK